MDSFRIQKPDPLVTRFPVPPDSDPAGPEASVFLSEYRNQSAPRSWPFLPTGSCSNCCRRSNLPRPNPVAIPVPTCRPVMPGRDSMPPCLESPAKAATRQVWGQGDLRQGTDRRQANQGPADSTTTPTRPPRRSFSSSSARLPQPLKRSRRAGEQRRGYLPARSPATCIHPPRSSARRRREELHFWSGGGAGRWSTTGGGFAGPGSQPGLDALNANIKIANTTTSTHPSKSNLTVLDISVNSPPRVCRQSPSGI
jgi:hypothetical protein